MSIPHAILWNIRYGSLFETYKVLNRFSFPDVACDEGLLRAIILPQAVIRQPGERQRRCQQPPSPVDGQIASADAGVVDSFISSELLFRYAERRHVLAKVTHRDTDVQPSAAR